MAPRRWLAQWAVLGLFASAVAMGPDSHAQTGSPPVTPLPTCPPGTPIPFPLNATCAPGDPPVGSSSGAVDPVEGAGAAARSPAPRIHLTG